MAECIIECYHSTNGNVLTELADFMGTSWKKVRITDGDIYCGTGEVLGNNVTHEGSFLQP